MSLLKRFGRRLVTFSAVAATACAAAPATEAKPASPAMWQVADADTTIYLFGTIHLLPKDTSWRSPAFDNAAAGADTLVVETVIDESKPEQTVAELFKLAISDGLPSITERVPAAKKDQLVTAIAKSGIPIEVYNKMETWAAAFILLGVQFKDLGLEPGSGVETALKKQFEGRGKTIGQLETNAEQLGFFDRLSEPSQREFLVSILDDPKAMNVEFDEMLAAWTRGDVKAIAQSFNSDLGGTSELKNALFTQRNANWARWVKGRLDQPGTVLVAVGAGHLAGEESLLSLLENQGVKVTRVQ
jgi:uncharacterized protein YbaP (TraB family)